MAETIQSEIATPRRGRLRNIPSENPAIVLATVDMVALFGTSMLVDPSVGLLRAPEVGPTPPPGAFLPAALLVAALCLDGAYSAAAMARPGSIIRRIVTLWLLAQLCIFATVASAGLDVLAVNQSLLAFALAAPIALVPQRLIIARRFRALGFAPERKVLLVTDAVPSAPHERPVETVVMPSLAAPDDEALRRLMQTIRRSDCDEIHLQPQTGVPSDYSLLLQMLREAPLPVRFIAGPAHADLLRYPVTQVGSSYALELQRPRLSFTDRLTKRAFDVLVAGALCLFFAPLMVLVAACLRLSSSEAVLFRQERGGREGRTFMIYKFRTMTVAESGSQARQATRHDPRVTLLGAFLRRASIDELPQLFNVLAGDMSLIGPRPHALAHDDAFAEAVPDYRLRQRVKPGLTGLAQVSGLRGEISELSVLERRVALDVQYIERWSLGLDLWIMIRTFRAVFGAKNAY